MKNRTLDISNYEEWFIDHLDGTLNAEEESQLQAFLLAHPDLASELEAMDEVQLEAKDIAFPDKSALLIPNEEELKLMLIAEEGSLADMQSLNATERDEIAALRRTIIKPDVTVVYPDHSELLQKESTPIIPMWLVRVAVAASVIGVVMAIFFNTTDSIYVPREGIALDEEPSAEDMLRADYSEFEYQEAESVDQEIEIVPLPIEPVSTPQIAQEEDLPQESTVPLQEDLPVPDDIIEDDFADLPDSTEIESLNEPLPLLAEEEETIKEDEEHESERIDNSLADLNTPSNVTAPNTTKEYSSVLDFLKDKVVKTAEDKDLLAMDDVSEEDKYVRTSFRIGGIQFSRLKKRK